MAIQTGQTISAGDFVGNPAPFFSIESTAGSTHSLTTVANQRVLVIATGTVAGDNNNMTVNLKYNGTVKHSVTVRTGVSAYGTAFALMYTEVPGAATQNITVDTVGGIGSVSSVVIMVQKLLVG